jgi:hypothetical protein
MRGGDRVRGVVCYVTYLELHILCMAVWITYQVGTLVFDISSCRKVRLLPLSSTSYK